MKKLLLLIAAIFVVFATAQCGNSHGLQKPDQERVYWSVGTWSDAVTAAESWTKGTVTSDRYTDQYDYNLWSYEYNFSIHYGWIKFYLQKDRRTPEQVVTLRNQSDGDDDFPFLFEGKYDPRKVLEDLWEQGVVEYAVIYHPGDTYFRDPLYDDYDFEIYWSCDLLNIWTYEDQYVNRYNLEVRASFTHHDLFRHDL